MVDRMSDHPSLGALPVPMMVSLTSTCSEPWMYMPSVLGLSPGALTVRPLMRTHELWCTVMCFPGLLINFMPLMRELLQPEIPNACYKTLLAYEPASLSRTT